MKTSVWKRMGTGIFGAGLCMAAFLAFGQTIDMAGLQLWNTEYWGTVHIGDYYGANYETKNFQPIRMVGCRNGVFSGYVVVTSSLRPMSGIKAAMSDMTHEGSGAKIPADRILVRYPEQAAAGTSWAPPYRFDRLMDKPPDEVDIVNLQNHRNWKPKKAGPVAMQPVWVTVHVPSDAKPGLYQGTLTITEDDNRPLTAPFEITVYDWELPDPRQYHILNVAWSNPDAVAAHYGAEMWSDRHLSLVRRSLEMALPLGSRHIDVNFVVRYPARDNPDTMVKWVRQADGSFTYDFSAFDRYMDMAGEAIGTPYPIRLNLWSAAPREPYHSVIVVDAASGERELMEQPPYGTEESLAFWKPVLDEVRQRFEKRGWMDGVGVNWHEYCGGPDSNTVSVLHKIWPDGKWISMDHGRRFGFRGAKPGEHMPAMLSSTVWNEGSMTARGYKNVRPLPELIQAFKDGRARDGNILSGHARGRHREWSPLWDLRVISEEQLMKGNHGVDPLGLDMWPIRDVRGRWRSGSWQAAALGPQNCTRAMLAPGPDGAIATERYEAFREGVQIGEAVMFIQRALASGKLNADLATKADKVLNERSELMLQSWVKAENPTDNRGNMEYKRHFTPSVMENNASASEHAVFAMAAEVARALR